MTGVIKIFIIIFVLSIIWKNLPFGTVGAGERGVRLRFSAVTSDVIDEGFYFKIPFIEEVIIMDVKTQKDQVKAQAASRDLQTVTAEVAVNFHITPDAVATVYQTIGEDYKFRVIDPAVQESVKASTAQFTAEELITRREDVREKVLGLLVSKMQSYGILIDGFNIIDFDFSKSFNQAIESKVTAEQDALAAKNRLEQVKFEADQRIAEAKGKAEAIRVESEALNQNPQILKLRTIEKWDGNLPTVTGGAVPFVNIP
ncbi:MAG: hypothetical protein A3C15_02845 [Candidatus Magasanikbacteria bacterium RIFCSPHIGHO2_02_FULL_50_9b]|uniref:Band 7 domain-containing protein n=1 Tax=Candidatus Magasanikbacteria bacterium RIFCSPHIGHO2_02_FULL_50_9b TaxID=1798682 RepID=A0A1F6M850_9BACT|nr:MAG: hypothetical protein A3C15_02845 [Candidatus Magasanikbacteria bacterium RIFCSPHIGHO2_02_FULL_50_9b]